MIQVQLREQRDREVSPIRHEQTTTLVKTQLRCLCIHSFALKYLLDTYVVLSEIVLELMIITIPITIILTVATTIYRMSTICQVLSKHFTLVVCNSSPQKINILSIFKMRILGFRSAKESQLGSGRARIQTLSAQT